MTAEQQASHTAPASLFFTFYFCSPNFQQNSVGGFLQQEEGMCRVEYGKWSPEFDRLIMVNTKATSNQILIFHILAK